MASIFNQYGNSTKLRLDTEISKIENDILSLMCYRRQYYMFDSECPVVEKISYHRILRNNLLKEQQLVNEDDSIEHVSIIGYYLSICPNFGINQKREKYCNYCGFKFTNF